MPNGCIFAIPITVRTKKLTNMTPDLNIPEYNQEIHGEPFGSKLVIGFTNVYYTLWRITFFNKVEHVGYLQNLSMDFAAAQIKAQEISDASFYSDGVEIDLDLKGDGGYSYFRPLAPKRYAPEFLAFSRFAGKDMRTINPNEEYFYAATKYGAEYKKMSGLLWATYLNKDEATVRGRRRRIIARQQLVNAGILVKVGRKYFTPEQIKKQGIRQEREAAINGHNEVDGKRIELLVKRLGEPFSFDTQYGTTYIVTLIDQNNRLFKYMGAKLPAIEDEFVQVKATIKHDAYKGQHETKLQRIKTA